MPEGKLYQFHEAAWEEFQAADSWYAERSVDASEDFLSGIADALKNIRSAPQRWPSYLYGARRLVVHRFPFSLIYLDDPDIVRIVAVAHAKRKPGYWKRRV